MKPAFRIILDILLFAAIINGWWPVAIALALIGAWFFKMYVEIIIAGIAYDALFGMTSGMGWRGYGGTICAITLLMAVKLLKRSIR